VEEKEGRVCGGMRDTVERVRMRTLAHLHTCLRMHQLYIFPSEPTPDSLWTLNTFHHEVSPPSPPPSPPPPHPPPSTSQPGGCLYGTLDTRSAPLTGSVERQPQAGKRSIFRECGTAARPSSTRQLRFGPCGLAGQRPLISLAPPPEEASFARVRC